jgi:hypothetical protein
MFLFLKFCAILFSYQKEGGDRDVFSNIAAINICHTLHFIYDMFSLLARLWIVVIIVVKI